ncbi:MAG: TonB-dependent siderophore receptor [Bacteriovoracia bacterium]
MIFIFFFVFFDTSFAREKLPLIDVGNSDFVPASHSRRYSLEEARPKGVTRLSDLTLFEAALTSNYSAGGYWDILSLRGIPLDNRSNYLREDLPISAETSIPLENKQALEVTKGPIGASTGAPSPAGMVNYKVKRPLAEDRVSLSLGWSQVNQQSFTIDHNVVLGAGWAARSMLAAEKLAPPLENSEGTRGFASFALDFRQSESSLWQWEVENSRQSAPSAAGFSMLGDRLPNVPNPRRNLNNQAWTKPVVFDALTSTLKNVTLLSSEWALTSSLGVQSLRTDDRLAYPYGCSKEITYDRFCSDGTFDVYDYRSENEKRLTTSARVLIETEQGPHALKLGAVWSQRRERFSRQAYNYVGEGRIDERILLPSSEALTAENTNRDSRQLELFLQEQFSLGAWKIHAKLSGNEIQRNTQRTDGSEKSRLREHFVLPSLGIEHIGVFTSYLSFSEGSELYSTPNRPDYSFAGRVLDRARSQQWEAGVKTSEIQFSVFQLTRPFLRDEAPVFRIDGNYRQRGVEVSTQRSWERWQWQQSAMAIAVDRSDNLKVVNVPNLTWRSHLGYQLQKDLQLLVSAIYEGHREVLIDGSRQLDPWWRFDVGLQWREVAIRVTNVFDSRYWRESPRQYGHTYLYAGEVRRLSVSWTTLF